MQAQLVGEDEYSIGLIKLRDRLAFTRNHAHGFLMTATFDSMSRAYVGPCEALYSEQPPSMFLYNERIGT